MKIQSYLLSLIQGGGLMTVWFLAEIYQHPGGIIGAIAYTLLSIVGFILMIEQGMLEL